MPVVGSFFYGFVAAVAVVVAQLPEACRALPQVCRGDGVLPVGACQIIADAFAGVSAAVWASRFAHARAVHFSDAAVRSLMTQISYIGNQTMTLPLMQFFWS